jgi:hypothetical protein
MAKAFDRLINEFKGNINLDDEEKGILKSLSTKKDEALNLNDITKYLKVHDYVDQNIKPREIREKMEHLADLGYVRSRTEISGNDREELYYLSNYVMGGVRKKSTLQNRGVFNDLRKFVQKFTGAIFLLFGLGFFVYEGLSLTGAFIFSLNNGATLTFVFSFALFIIGGFLLIKKR